MPDNYYNPEDPTLPVRPRSPQQGQGPQGKLVIGGFQDVPKSPQRQPYRHSPQKPPVGQPDQAPWQAPQAMSAPAIGNPPHVHGGGVKGTPIPKRKRRNGCLIGCLVVLVLACVLGGLTVTTTQRALAFGTAISTKAPLSSETGFMGTSNRTNLLVIGYGGGEHEGAMLTDSLLVVSMLPQNSHTSMVSIPRDLVVQVPENSGIYGKINTVYQQGSNFGEDRVAGGDAVARKVTSVTGLETKYWMTIDFNGFRKLIDAIGGIDVVVPAAFTADYPKNDNPEVDASWITVQFEKGPQHMDGETAIRYARARYVKDNGAESTDYARAARQQIIVKAVLSKVQQMSTWPKLFDAMSALESTIYTNMSLADLGLFTRKMDLNDPHTARIGLSTSNVLAEDASYNLHPKDGNWQLIHDYVKENLYN